MDGHAGMRIPSVVNTIGGVWSHAFAQATNGRRTERLRRDDERGREREMGGKGKVDEGDARFVKAAADHFKGEDGALRTGRVVASVESASARILAPTLVAWAAILCAEEPVADGGRAHRYALRCGAHGD